MSTALRRVVGLTAPDHPAPLPGRVAVLERRLDRLVSDLGRQSVALQRRLADEDQRTTSIKEAA
jgi:hypothetical protein